MRAARLLAPMLLLAVASAACGGGGDDASPVKDRARAQSAVDSFSDQLKGDGFTGTPPDKSRDDLQFKSADCKAFEKALPDDGNFPGKTASVDSDDFAKGELGVDQGVQESVSASVLFTKGEGDLRELFALLGDDRLPDCLGEAVQQSIASSAGEGGTKITVSGVSVDSEQPDAGDEARAFTIQASIDAAGTSFPAKFDIEFVRVGRSAAFVIVSAVGGDQPTADRDELAKLLADQLQAA